MSHSVDFTTLKTGTPTEVGSGIASRTVTADSVGFIVINTACANNAYSTVYLNGTSLGTRWGCRVHMASNDGIRSERRYRANHDLGQRRQCSNYWCLLHSDFLALNQCPDGPIPTRRIPTMKCELKLYRVALYAH